MTQSGGQTMACGERREPRTRGEVMERRVMRTVAFVSRMPWASEAGSAFADDVCRR
jgi:hypothetical protein